MQNEKLQIEQFENIKPSKKINFMKKSRRLSLATTSLGPADYCDLAFLDSGNFGEESIQFPTDAQCPCKDRG